LMGCGADKPSDTTKPTQNNAAASVASEKSGEQIPDTFPKEIYLPPDYVFVSSMEVKADQQNLNISVSTAMGSEEAAAALKDDMLKKGWTLSFDSSTAAQTMLILEKTPQAVIVFTGKDAALGKTMVSYQYMPTTTGE
jgi:hypothetical protein